MKLRHGHEKSNSVKETDSADSDGVMAVDERDSRMLVGCGDSFFIKKRSGVQR